MKRVFTAILLCLCISGYSQNHPQFLNPPDEARPWIFWDWMNDLVSKKGITSDLEHFKKFGVNGTLLMLIGSETGSYPFWEKHNMPNPVVSQTPEFFEHVEIRCRRVKPFRNDNHYTVRTRLVP